MKPRQPLHNLAPDQYQNSSINFQSTHQSHAQNQISGMNDEESPSFQEFLKIQTMQANYEEEEMLNDDYDRPFKSYFSFQDPNKKYSNLAAIDCFATIYGQNYYQKTYQDQLRVDQLVGDVLLDERPLNIDKLFRSHDSNQQSYSSNINKHLISHQAKKNQESLNTMGKIDEPKKTTGYEDTMLVLSPDYYNQNEQDSTHCLEKLFEDPDEKLLKIQTNIEKSKNKKRKRLNSGVSNQSQVRSGSSYQPKYLCNKTMESNSDLLRTFNEDIFKQNISLDFIQQKLQDQNIHQQLLNAFESARNEIRMEDPTRLLTRLGLNLVKSLFTTQTNQIGQNQLFQSGFVTNQNNLFHDQCISIGGNDNMSYSQQSIQDFNQTNSISNVSKKRGYKQWSYKEEQQLRDYALSMNKSLNELNDAELSELSQKLNRAPQHIFWKVQKLQKEEEKRESTQHMSIDNKIPKKDMIQKALLHLPNHRGSKKEIFRKIEQIYNLTLQKNDSAYKTLEQALSKFFYKCPQEYLLNMNQDFSKFDVGNNPTMKQMLISCLLKMRDFRGAIKEIKVKMIQLFGELIRSEYVDRSSRSCGNLQEWERTMLKTFSRHKDVFSKVKAVFSLQNNFNNSESSHVQRENASMSLIMQQDRSDRSAQGPTIIDNDDQTMSYSMNEAQMTQQNQSVQNQTHQQNQNNTDQIQITILYQYKQNL